MCHVLIFSSFRIFPTLPVAAGRFLCGLTVALALVPEAVAFALAAGLPPDVGLNSAWIISVPGFGFRWWFYINIIYIYIFMQFYISLYQFIPVYIIVIWFYASFWWIFWWFRILWNSFCFDVDSQEDSELLQKTPGLKNALPLSDGELCYVVSFNFFSEGAQYEVSCGSLVWDAHEVVLTDVKNAAFFRGTTTNRNWWSFQLQPLRMKFSNLIVG